MLGNLMMVSSKAEHRLADDAADPAVVLAGIAARGRGQARASTWLR